MLTCSQKDKNEQNCSEAERVRHKNSRFGNKFNSGFLLLSGGWLLPLSFLSLK